MSRKYHKHRNGYMNGHMLGGDAAITEEPPVPLRPNPENYLPVPRLKFHVAATTVFIVSVVCFAISYDGDFVFDDSEAILGNKDLLPETPVSNLIINDFWGKKLDSKTSHKSYRPLTVFSFRISYLLGGGLVPAWFHVPNIILHGIVSVLLIPVFSLLFGGYVVDEEIGCVQFKAAKSSFLCALLFAVHPIHTESVSGVVGRADLICALLFLSSFLFYVKACAADLNTKDEKQTIYRPSTFSLPHLVVSMLLACLSVFAKEQGITVIGICCAYDIIMVCGVDILDLLGLRRKPHKNGDTNGNGNGKSKSWTPPQWVLSSIKRHVVLLTTGVLLLIYRVRIMGSTAPTFQTVDNPHSFVNGTIFRGINYNYLYSINAWLLVNPWWLCFDWSMGCVPTIETLSDPRIVCSVLVWVIIGSLLWVCLKGPITHDQRVLTMALAFIIVPFLPGSNLFFRVGFVIAERILYMSSIGFCMLIILGVRQMCVTFPKHVKLMQAALVFLMCIFVARCIQRSSQWRNEVELFTSGTDICPLNAKVHYNIGKVNSDLDNMDDAISEYRLAIELNPQYDQAMNNLGNILKDKGEVLEAEQLLERAVNIREEFAAAWMNLGIVKATLKKYQESEVCYGTALRHRKKYPDCYYNLGNLYLEVKNHERAITAFRNATRQKPTHAVAWTNLAVVFDNLGRYEESIETALEGLKHVPDEPKLYFNLGNVYGRMSRFEESEKNFLKAIQLNPSSAQFHANLGVLYHRWNKYDTAEVNYKKALSLNPQEPSVQDNLNMLYNSMKLKLGTRR